MAISELLPGIEVVVTVDGKGLQEYPDDDAEAEERTTTSYIEAMTGKHFGIRVTTKSDFQLHGDALMVVFKVDGFKSDSFVVHREDMTVSSSTWSSRGSWSTGELRKYQFSAVQFVDDGSVPKGDVKDLRNLGSIAVTVDHVLTTEDKSVPGK